MEQLEDNNTVRTIGKGGRRRWVFPELVFGRWVTARTAVHTALLALLLLGPWVDVGGHAAIHFDIPNRRFYFWGLKLFATDAPYLLFLFLGVLFSVFFVTALSGRGWCGWACPQTVFLESLIRPIERAIEGGASAQRKVHASPWTAAKLIRRGIKWSAFAVVAGGIATTFTAYFLGRQGVWEAQADPWSHPVGTAFFLAISAGLLFDFVWFREQTCLVVCPYGRFQSVLLDRHSLTVGYDARRGEPRGKASDPDAADCVDCGRCVRVCPTAIDIRDGVQLECVQCMACIDACDAVMKRLDRPTGLVRLTSEAALAGEAPKIVRPRVLVYGAVLAAVLTVGLFSLTRLGPFDCNLTRLPDAAVMALPDGRIQNTFRLRIANKSDTEQHYTLSLPSSAPGELILPVPDLRVGPSAVEHFVVFVRRGEGRPDPVILRVKDANGATQDLRAAFLRPPTGAPSS